MPIQDLLSAFSGPFLGNILSFSVGEDAKIRNFTHDKTTRWQESVGPFLEASCALNLEPAHRAAVLSVVVTNTSPTETVVLNPVVFRMLLSERGIPYRGFRAAGGLADGHYPPENFRSQEVLILGSLVNCSPAGGRSSDRNIPISMISDELGAGMWMGLEWSGAWAHILQTPRHGNAVRVADHYGLSVRVLVGDASPLLKPGETLALPPLHFGFFDNGFEEGTNVLRRYLYDKICPRLNGREPCSPVSYDHFFGVGEVFDQKFIERQIERAAELGLEYFVLDAAWHAGGFPNGVGNWFHDASKLPDGLEALARKARGHGLKFGLWLEVERASRESIWVKEHPEIFIDIGTPNLLLNLARRDAQDFVIDFLTELFSRTGLQWTRWDFNIDPMPYWKKADPTGRIQFDYIAGLYRVLDILMKRFPEWLVEACASGGRRLDIGTMRRAHTCWFSDETVAPEICRYMQLNANRFLPAHLCNSGIVAFRDNGDGALGAYDVLSRMAGALLFSGDIAAWSPALTGQMRDGVMLYKQLRHLWAGDYYHLLPPPVDWRDWDAGMFVSRDKKEAVLFTCRMDGIDAQTVVLRGLLPGAYEVNEEMSDTETRILQGHALMETGLRIDQVPRSAKCFHLRLKEK